MKNKEELIEEISETLDAYDSAYEGGMDHEEGYDFAEQLRDVLVEALRMLRCD